MRRKLRGFNFWKKESALGEIQVYMVYQSGFSNETEFIGDIYLYIYNTFEIS